ncbi:MAG: CPBP family intramembrane metalloprotease [Cytophagia bacterium]|nr:CPBP family intramembrane metalloprotease [Cytophagia bacterium]
MARLNNGIDLTGRNSDSASALIVFGFLLVGFFVGQFLAGTVLLGMAVMNGVSIGEIIENPNILYESVSLSQALISQVFYTLLFTFVTPWFYLKTIANKKLSSLSTEKSISLLPLILTALGTFTFMIVNSYFIEWNENFKFPEFMAGFEKWARETEDQAAAMTEQFTNFSHFGEYLLGMLVISILPGIGEEIMFRGVLQNSLHRWTKNPHIAIWVSAFIFGAIHMQFFGLVPRMMLGAVFGYLYVWSGNIWYPIIAHALNNGIGVTMAYAAQFSEGDLNLDDTETFPVYGQVFAAVVFIAIMVIFRNQYLRSNSSE